MEKDTSIKLSNEGIASAVSRAEEYLAAQGVERRLSLRATMLLEEMLLGYQDEFGAEASFEFETVKRFGTLMLRTGVRGHRFDALARGSVLDEAYGDGAGFIEALMDDDFDAPTFGYRNGVNVATIGIRVRKARPLWMDPLLISTVLAVIAFLVLKGIGATWTESFLTNAVQPVISALMGALSAITGPLLALSLISGICALGSIAALKRTGLRAIGRIMIWVIVMFVVSVAVGTLVYGGGRGQDGAAFDAAELFALLLSAIPSNLIAPFVENNSLQIAVESVFIGVCLLALADRSKEVRALVVELNALSFKMMFIFSKALPLLVGLSIFKTLMTTDVSSLAAIGGVVVTSLVLTAVLTAGTLVWLFVRLRVSPASFIKKIWPVLLIALTTGSSTTAMGENFRLTEHDLGVDKRVVDFWLPLGQAMFAPSVIVPLVIGMYAVASMEGVAFGPGRVIVLFILVFQLSIASPKVPGGIAATFTILLGQLGLPLEAVGILMAANVFVCNPETAYGMLVRDAEICAFAAGEGALDIEKLRS